MCSICSRWQAPTCAALTSLDAGCGFGFAMVVYALLGAKLVRGLELYAGMVDTVDAYQPLLPADLRSRLEVRRGDVSFENGPAGREVHGHTVGDQPYVTRRQARVEARLPERMRDPELAAQLARNTAGSTYEQVDEAVDEYLASGRTPRSPYRWRDVAISPEGIAIERQIWPDRLARDLAALGFDARAYGYWGGANGKRAIRTANAVLTKLSWMLLPTARAFRVVARKRRE